MAALLYLYNLKLKALPLWGNLAVALLCALAVYFPEYPGFPIHTGLPALFAFLTTLAREITKDAEDILGDTAVGRITFPIRYGMRFTRSAVRLVTALVLALLPIPYLWLDYHPSYGLLILLGPVPLLFLVLQNLSRTIPDWGKIQRTLKGAMLAGMLALFVGIII
jgi:4-hydroxybenzoate polyprenyltransferase